MSAAHVATSEHGDSPELIEDLKYFGKATGGKIAMWMFIAQDGMSFGGLLFGYGILRSSAQDWPIPAEVLGIGLTAVATFILICSSLSMVFAVLAAQEKDQGGLVRWLSVTIAGGVAFLGIQVYEYYHLVHSGIGFSTSSFQGEPINNLFGTTFYAVTGFHGLHVLTGVIYLCCILKGALAGKYTQGGLSFSPVELVGLFWHFVDLVWILVFTFIYLL
ncbi:MAG: cytochrome c oxidase subunit 3 [Planctomycetota bacterium]|jgi:cytochrome c oxidase subunit 3